MSSHHPLHLHSHFHSLGPPPPPAHLPIHTSDHLINSHPMDTEPILQPDNSESSEIDLNSPPPNSDFGGTTLHRTSEVIKTQSKQEEPYGIDPRLEEGTHSSSSSPHLSKPVGFYKRTFEPIHWPNLILLTVTVAGSWPFGRFLPHPWVTGLSLNWARLYVGLIGIIIGLAMGAVLVFRIARKLYDAVVFSTLAHAEVAVHGQLNSEIIL